MSITDARFLKSLRFQKVYARRSQDRNRLLRKLAQVVRENIGRKVMRGAKPSPQTIRLDRIRDALVELDNHERTKP